MAYRSVLGAYSKPRALVSAKTARAVDFYQTVTGSTTILNYVDTNLDTSEPRQLINVSSSPQAYIGLSEYAITLSYNTSDNNRNLSGLAFRLHYDSSKLSLLTVDNHVPNGFIEASEGLLDTDDLDNDATTDKFVRLRWLPVTEGATWPGDGDELPIELATVKFSVSDDFNNRGNTDLNFSPVTTPYGYIFRAETFPIDIAYVSFDVDKDGRLDALSDGLMFLRHLFSDASLRTVESITQGAISAQSPLTPQQVADNVDTVVEVIGDIDDSGSLDALTDGLLLLRYAFGIRGEALVNQATAIGANRTTHEEVEAYIEKFLPQLDEVITPEAPKLIQKADTRSVLSVTIPKVISSAISLKAINSVVTPRLVDPVLSEISRKIHAEKSFIDLQAVAHYANIVPIVSYPRIVAKDIGALPLELPLGSDFDITEILTRVVGKSVSSPDVSLGDAAPHFAVGKLVEADGFSVKDKESLRVIFSREFSGADEQVTLTEESAFNFGRGPTADKHTSKETVTPFGYFSAPTTNDLFGMSDSAIPKYGFSRSDSDDSLTVSETSVEKSFATTELNSLESAETIVQFIDYSETLTDSITMLDTMLSESITATKANVFGFNDKQILRAEYERVFSGADETISNITESAILNVGLLKTDNQNSEESLFNVTYNSVNPTEGIGIGELSTLSIELTKSNSVPISDTAPKFSIAKPLSNNMFSGETIISSAYYHEDVADTFTIEDTLIAGDIDSNKANSFSVGDVFSRKAEFERTFSGFGENISDITDAQSLHIGYFINDPLDNQSLSETVANVVFAQELINEVISVKDVLTPSFGKRLDFEVFVKDSPVTIDYIKPEANVARPSESVASFRNYHHNATDAFTLDTTVSLGDINLGKGNIFGVSDKDTLKAEFEREFSGADENITGITDAPAFTQGKAPTDSSTLKETVLFNATYVENPVNILSLLEQVTPLLTKRPTSPALVIADEDTFSYAKNLDNSVGTDEVVGTTSFYFHTAVDAFTLDSVASLGDINLDKGNVFAIGDRESLKVIFNRTFSGADENITSITDVPKFTQGKTPTDNMFSAEGTLVFPYFAVVESDSAGLLDYAKPSLGKIVPLSLSTGDSQPSLIYDKLLANTANASENVFTSLSYIHKATDAFTLDSVASLGDIGIDKQNIFGVGDVETLRAEYTRVFKDASESFLSINEFKEANIIISNTGAFSSTNRRKKVFMAGEVVLPSSFSNDAECLFEHGGSGQGTWIGITTDDGVKNFHFRTGDGATGATNQVQSGSRVYKKVPISQIPEFDGNAHTVAWEISPKDNYAKFWIDQRLVIYETISSLAMWSGGNSGGWLYGVDSIAGFGSGSSANPYRTAWSGASQSTLRVYTDQDLVISFYSVTEASTITQGKGLTETQTIAESLVTNLYHAFKFVPTVFNDLNVVRFAQDTQSFSFGKDISNDEDKATMGDSAPVFDIINAPSDGHTTTEIVSIFSDHKEILTDFITLEDDSAVAQNETKNKVNFFGFSDKQIIKAEYGRTFSEPNEFTFTDVAALSPTKKLTDSHGASEALVNVHNYIEKLSSLITLTEERFVTLSKHYALQRSDLTFSVGDEPTLKVEFDRTFTGASEEYEITEESTLKPGKGVTDSVSSQEASYIQPYYVEKILETITITEDSTETHGEGFGVSSSKKVSISDEPILRVEYERLFSGADEEYGITDAQPVISTVKGLSETPAPVEAVVQFVDYKEIIADPINVSDTAIETLAVVHSKEPSGISFGVSDEPTLRVIYDRTFSGASEEFGITEVSVLSNLKQLSNTAATAENVNQFIPYQEPTTSSLTFGTDTVTVNLARSLRVSRTETISLSDDITTQSEFDGLSVGGVVFEPNVFTLNNPDVVLIGGNTSLINFAGVPFYSIGTRAEDNFNRGEIRQLIPTVQDTLYTLELKVALSWQDVPVRISAIDQNGAVIFRSLDIGSLQTDQIIEVQFTAASNETLVIIDSDTTAGLAGSNGGGLLYVGDIKLSKNANITTVTDAPPVFSAVKALSETPTPVETTDARHYYVEKHFETITLRDDKPASKLEFDVTLINLNLSTYAQVFQTIDLIYGTVNAQPSSAINEGTLYQHSEALRIAKLFNFPSIIVDYFQQLYDIKLDLQVERSMRQSKTVGPAPASAPSGPPESELSISEQSSLQIGINLADTAVLSDVPSLTATFDRSFGETFGLDDLSDLPTTSVLNKTNTFGLSEVVTKTIAFGRAVSDSSTILESASLNLNKDFGHSLGISDSPTISTTKAAGDFAGFTETVSLSFSKGLTDTQNTSDNGGTIVYSQSTTDSFGITESISTSLVRTTGAVNYGVINDEPLN